MGAKHLLNKLPFRLLVPIAFVLFYFSILLYVVLSPLIFLYGLLLCPMVWIEWGRQGKDVLVIENDSAHSQEWISRILPLIGERAVVLNYSQRDSWERLSLASQLFEIFGPQAMPERFRERSLPAVILFRKLHRPKKIIFGDSKECEAKLGQLRAELALD
jgi:hypothetical protein